MDLDALEIFLDKVCRPEIERAPKVGHKRPSQPVAETASDSVSLQPAKRHKLNNSVLLANLPKDVDQKRIRSWLSETAALPTDSITKIEIGIDRLNSYQSAGWCIVDLLDSTDQSAVIKSLDYHMFDGRCVYCVPRLQNERKPVTFRLPDDLISQIKQLTQERQLNDGPAGRLADAYRRTFGHKIPFDVYGFRSFVHALQSISEIKTWEDAKNNCTYFHWQP